jgi:hypothetical protein
MRMGRKKGHGGGKGKVQKGRRRRRKRAELCEVKRNIPT